MKASMFKYSSMTSLSRFENGSYHVNTVDSKIVHQPRGRLPLWVLLDGIQDPRNMGSIIRSAFFFGADAVMIPSRLSCKPTPAVSRTSSGAMECLPIYRATRVDRVLKEAKASGWAVISTATVGGLASKPVAPSDIPCLTKPTVLVIGSEEKGVSEKVAPLSDINVHIPAHAELPGHLDSLNAGVAAGIILSNLKVHA
ncbi:hypothetical protein GGF46_003150 [Coemansia sp. RSA 552]|nr:hypothetical protein GGF46_003150 [Coemansia sp. RSA 552]